MSVPKNYKALCLDFFYAYSELATIKTNKELDKKRRIYRKMLLIRRNYYAYKEGSSNL